MIPLAWKKAPSYAGLVLRTRLVLALCAAALLGGRVVALGAAVSDSAAESATPFDGAYRDDRGATIQVEHLAGDIYYLMARSDWEGVGFLQGREYHGVFRRLSPARPGGVRGSHVIFWRDDGSLEAHIGYEGSAQSTIQRWLRVPRRSEPRPEEPRHDEEFPYVEEMPEALTKVAPSYPEAARQARIEGTVIVQARILEDGRVGATRVTRSIPELDDAALACVRQWRFRPALKDGKPVVVWVAVPVKFTLH